MAIAPYDAPSELEDDLVKAFGLEGDHFNKLRQLFRESDTINRTIRELASKREKHELSSDEQTQLDDAMHQRTLKERRLHNWYRMFGQLPREPVTFDKEQRHAIRMLHQYLLEFKSTTDLDTWIQAHPQLAKTFYEVLDNEVARANLDDTSLGSESEEQESPMEGMQDIDLQVDPKSEEKNHYSSNKLSTDIILIYGCPDDFSAFEKTLQLLQGCIVAELPAMNDQDYLPPAVKAHYNFPPTVKSQNHTTPPKLPRTVQGIAPVIVVEDKLTLTQSNRDAIEDKFHADDLSENDFMERDFQEDDSYEHDFYERDYECDSYQYGSYGYDTYEEDNFFDD